MSLLKIGMKDGCVCTPTCGVVAAEPEARSHVRNER